MALFCLSKRCKFGLIFYYIFFTNNLAKQVEYISQTCTSDEYTFGKYTFRNYTFGKYTFRKYTEYSFGKYTFGKYKNLCHIGAVHILCQPISGVFRPPLTPSSAFMTHWYKERLFDRSLQISLSSPSVKFLRSMKRAQPF